MHVNHFKEELFFLNTWSREFFVARVVLVPMLKPVKKFLGVAPVALKAWTEKRGAMNEIQWPLGLAANYRLHIKQTAPIRPPLHYASVLVHHNLHCAAKYILNVASLPHGIDRNELCF